MATEKMFTLSFPDGNTYEIADAEARNKIGNVENLQTENKSNLVSAINEMFLNGGNDGKSAYELAVENGFVGTVQEWLNSLVGKSLTFDDLTPEQVFGLKGEDGIGVVSVEKTSTLGLVDTYTITYTDDTTSTFTVTNGQNGNDYVLTEADKVEIAEQTRTKLEPDISEISEGMTALEQKIDNIIESELVEIDITLTQEGQAADAKATGVTINNMVEFEDDEEEVEFLTLDDLAEIEESLDNKANISDIPLKTSQLENDSGFLTEHQDLSNYATKIELDSKYSKPETGIPESDLSEDVKKKLNSNNGITWRIENGILYADYEENGGNA